MPTNRNMELAFKLRPAKRLKGKKRGYKNARAAGRSDREYLASLREQGTIARAIQEQNRKESP